jgi:hypothetical protein
MPLAATSKVIGRPARHDGQAAGKLRMTDSAFRPAG